MEDYLCFTRQGTTYIAYKGHAHAEGCKKWGKDGVFLKNPITKEAVFELEKFMLQKEYPEDWYKKRYSFE